MTAAPSQTPEAAGLYLLMKRGLYYRPDAMGYTGIKDHAGRYTKDEAESHADPASGVTMIAEAEAEDFAPNCYDDLACNHLQEKLASAQAAIDAEKARADRLAKDATGLLAEIASFGRAFMTVQESLASTSTPDAYDDAILAASLHYKVVVKTASALYRAALQQEV